jgi:Tol biopolymer transport system component
MAYFWTYLTSGVIAVLASSGIIPLDATAENTSHDQGYNFEIRVADQVNSASGLEITFEAKICGEPAPTEIVDVRVDYYYTRPDGVEETKEGHTIIDPDAWCSTIVLGSSFLDMIGTWSIRGIATLTVEDSILEVSSNIVTVDVKEAVFAGGSLERMNIEKLTQLTGVGKDNIPFELLDWSSDGKFILFEYYSPTIRLGMMTPDAAQVNKLDIPIQFNNPISFPFSGARFSPSGDFILLLGRLHENDVAQVFEYDIRERKAVQITDSDSYNPVTLFDWVSDGSIVLGEELYNEKPEYIGYNLWLAAANGTKITKLYGWSFDSSVNYTPLNDERLHFSQIDVSPDGKNIVIVSYKVKGAFRGSFSLTILDMEKGELKNLLVGDPPVRSPRWSPNNEFIIYYLASSDVSSRGGELEITNVDRTIHERLYVGTEDPHDEPATFIVSPDGSSIIVGIDPSPYQGGVVEKLFRLQFTHAIAEFSTHLTILTVVALIAVLVVSRLKDYKSLELIR